MNEILLIVMAYLIGSIPSALIIGKLFFRGIDIRDHGSGNLGTTNALRTIGGKGAIGVAAFDVFIKGTLVSLIASIFYKQGLIELNPIFIAMFSGIGHSFPIFANFRGGKCVATTIGILVGINFFIGLITAIILFTVLIISKYMSLAAFTAITSGLTIYLVYYNLHIYGIIVCYLYVAFIFYLHRSNIKRLINHEEKKTDILKKLRKS